MTERVTDANREEYEAFVRSSPKAHFAQSTIWAKQKPQWTWEGLLVRREGQIRGVMGMLIRRLPVLGWSMMYACRGPVCDPEDRQTIVELVEAAKELGKARGAYVLKLDPDVPSENRAFLALWQSLGARFPDRGRDFGAVQPRYVFRLDTAGKSREELMAAFHPKWRYNIRLAQRRGVEVRCCGVEMVPAFSALMEVTGARDGFRPRPAAYFRLLLENFGESARLYMAFSPEREPIAGTIALHYGDKVWYLYGASANEDRRLMPNYLLQWQMICWAVETGARLYDFRGVSGDLSEDNPLYGLYRFKRGFGGRLVEFIGEMDLVLRPGAYWAAERLLPLYRRARGCLYRWRKKGPEGG